LQEILSLISDIEVKGANHVAKARQEKGVKKPEMFFSL
jgi:hypothetical protein